MNELLKQIKIILSFLIDAKPVQCLPHTDGIFVFGCFDGRVASQAAMLFNKMKAPHIVVSGKGKAERLPDGFTTEADYFDSILAKQNIPKTAIILEKNATNTLENVIFGVELIKQNFSELSSMILCAKPQHLRRARATFAKQYPELKTYGSAYEIDDNEWINNPRLVYKILREIEKLRIYSAKGDIAVVEIPPNVNDAYTQAIVLREKLSQELF